MSVFRQEVLAAMKKAADQGELALDQSKFALIELMEKAVANPDDWIMQFVISPRPKNPARRLPCNNDETKEN